MHRNLRLLALFNFLTDLDFVAPIAILLFTKISGSYTLGMSVFSAVMISSALFEVPTGVFSDVIGRKRTLVLGSLAGLAGAIILALSTSYGFLLVSAACMGLARAFYSGNNEALLYDSLKEKGKQGKFGGYLGKLAAFFQIALAVSAFLGGYLAQWSFSWVLWLAVIPKAGMVAVSLFFTEPKTTKHITTNIFSHFYASYSTVSKNPRLILLVIASTLRFSLGEAAYVFRSAFVATIWPLWAIGIVNMFSHIGAALSYSISGMLMAVFSPAKLLRFEIIYNRLANLVALTFPTIASPALMSSTSLTFGAADTALKTLLHKEFTDKQRATLGSFVSLANQLAFGIMSILLGYFADLLGPTNTLIVVNIILFLPLGIYWKLFRK